MPCIKGSNGEWKMGKKGKARYKTKKDCEQAYHAYLAKKHSDGRAK